MVYFGGKAFLHLFSGDLQTEVAEHGIEVQSLGPGFADSELHDRMGLTGAGVRRVQMPDELWMETSEMVADSPSSLDSDRVTVSTGDHRRATAVEDLQLQIDELIQKA